MEAEREKVRREQHEENKQAEAEKEQERQKTIKASQQKGKADNLQYEKEWGGAKCSKRAANQNCRSKEGSSDVDNDLLVTKHTHHDDIEAYLTTFERLMAVYNIPRTGGSPQLTRKVQQAYAVLTTEDTFSYDITARRKEEDSQVRSSVVSEPVDTQTATDAGGAEME